MRKPLLAIRRSPVLIGGLLLFAIVLALALHSGSAEPHYSRSQVIAAALKGYKANQFSRVQVKLMHRHDIEAVLGGDTIQDPNALVWVVAVSGNYGIGPSFGCCSVPADYPGHNTWGVAVIEDSAPTPEPREFAANWHGDWPPFFDALPDLASGH